MKSLFSALSPNVEKDDLELVRHLIRGRGENYHGAKKLLMNAFSDYMGVEAIAFQSGRSALWAIMRSFSWPKDSEIIISGFTCAAAANPLIWAGLKPIFVDIDESLNINVSFIEKFINPKTKAILVQHTFGLPVNMEQIKNIAERYNLKIIEDCAHSLGASFDDKLTGVWGDASFFSFGRDKIISSIFGGMAVSKDKEIIKRISLIEKRSEALPKSWTRQQLKHPLLVNRWVQPLYGKKEIGRKLLLIFQKLGILSKSMSRDEKKSIPPEIFPAKIPDELAMLALLQLGKIERYNKHRSQLAKYYEKSLKDLPIIMPQKSEGRIYLKFPIIMADRNLADRLLRFLRHNNIYLYDGWKNSPIVPSDVFLPSMKYKIGSCPSAEDLSGRIVNLPTHINISLDDAARISKTIIEFFNSL